MTHVNEVLIAQNEAIIQLLMEITTKQDTDTTAAIDRAQNTAAGWLAQIDENLKLEEKEE